MAKLIEAHSRLKKGVDITLKRNIKIPSPEEQVKRWNDAIGRAVQMATLGSISFLAASSAPNINEVQASLHPQMITFFLIGALLFVFCASAVMFSAFLKGHNKLYKIMNIVIRISSIIGVILFFMGALLAVIFLVF
jgi:hypothetical protein